MATRTTHTPRPPKRRHVATVQMAMTDFLLDHQSQHHSPQTIRWHTIALSHFCTYLEQTHDITVLEQIEPYHVRAWLVFLETEIGPRGNVRATRTRRWYAQSVHAFGRWLYHEHYMREDFTERVKLPKLEKPLIRIIEFDEFRALLDACAPPQEISLSADRNASRNRAILWLLWDTGIRIHELCDLRLQDIDRQQGTMIVLGKGQKERRVALGRNALRMLLSYIDRWRYTDEDLMRMGLPKCDHVFLSENGPPLTLQGIQMLFKRLRTRAHITDHRITPHTFRHTFAVRYLMLGGGIFSLQEMLGHEDISTVKHYMHLNDLNVQTQKRKFSPGDNVPFLQTPNRRGSKRTNTEKQGGSYE